MSFVKMNGVTIRGSGAPYTTVEDTGVSVASFREKREQAAQLDRERLAEMTKQRRLALEAHLPVEFPVTHATSVRDTVTSSAELAGTMREALGYEG